MKINNIKVRCYPNKGRRIKRIRSSQYKKLLLSIILISDSSQTEYYNKIYNKLVFILESEIKSIVSDYEFNGLVDYDKFSESINDKILNINEIGRIMRSHEIDICHRLFPKMVDGDIIVTLTNLGGYKYNIKLLDKSSNLYIKVDMSDISNGFVISEGNKSGYIREFNYQLEKYYNYLLGKNYD